MINGMALCPVPVFRYIQASTVRSAGCFPAWYDLHRKHGHDSSCLQMFWETIGRATLHEDGFILCKRGLWNTWSNERLLRTPRSGWAPSAFFSILTGISNTQRGLQQEQKSIPRSRPLQNTRCKCRYCIHKQKCREGAEGGHFHLEGVGCLQGFSICALHGQSLHKDFASRFRPSKLLHLFILISASVFSIQSHMY